jgi:tetratricopeptide (TPR) repeat protein
MRNFKIFLFFSLTAAPGAFGVSAQTQQAPPPPAARPRSTPAPIAGPQASPTPKLSVVLAPLVDNRSADIGREQREQAFAKLLEGQRFIFQSDRSQSQAEFLANTRFARQSFQKAVELNPNLSEGYTGLADLTLRSSGDLEEAYQLALLAIKVNPDNFGAHRISARVLTMRSRLNSGNLEQVNAAKALAAWRETARLDARSAEAWAFISEFENRNKNTEAEIDALRKWQASATPLDARFFRTIMGGQDLSPQLAAVRLGRALLKAGKESEAVETLSRVIADEPENEEAVDLLREAIETSYNNVSGIAIQSLQQAIFSNPDNIALVEVLAQIQARTGLAADAVKTYETAISRLAEKDADGASRLQVSLGDLYTQEERTEEAVKLYQAAIKTRGIGGTEIPNETERDFASLAVSRIAQVYKNVGKFAEAKAAIEKSRPLFGKDDMFPDFQMLSLLRDSGDRKGALTFVRDLRRRFPTSDDFTFQEASILVESGRTEEGVNLYRAKIVNKGKTVFNETALNKDFESYLLISALYTQGKQGVKAVDAARSALALARDDFMRERAELGLATAQNEAGDFKSADLTLRGLLKRSPDNAVALNNLGYFLVERNERLSEALEMIQRAVKSQPNNPSFLDSLGWAHFKLNQLELAEKYLKDAARLNPTAPVILEHLGDVYAKQNKPDLARTAWQKALRATTVAADVAKLKTKIGKKR